MYEDFKFGSVLKKAPKKLKANLFAEILKVPKREIFVTELIILSHPI